MVITALVLTILASVFGGSIFGLILEMLGMAAYIYSFFRIFSKNVNKRRSENMQFLYKRNAIKTNISQFFTRLKNLKKYKYYHCPNCKAMLKLPRKVGEVTVTCGKCKHVFKQKA